MFYSKELGGLKEVTVFQLSDKCQCELRPATVSWITNSDCSVNTSMRLLQYEYSNAWSHTFVLIN